MRLRFRSLSLFALCLSALCFTAIHQASAQGKGKPLPPAQDFIDRISIEFTAIAVQSEGEGKGNYDLPAEEVTGTMTVLVGKVAENNLGYWNTNRVRVVAMNIKVGQYKMPMTRVVGAIDYIDERPMKFEIGRSIGGLKSVSPGVLDFLLTLRRDSRSGNDFSLEFSNFAFTIFGHDNVTYKTDQGTARIRIKKEQTVKQKEPAVDFGFSIGGYNPDAN